MGGTTAKSCLIQDGVAGVVPTFEVGRVQRFQKGSGLTIQVPVVDLMEIGAGGGSIARASRLGTLQVGPQSAGAEPGPICYGRGGIEPTVTDADLLLGYLDAGLLPRRHDAARRRRRAARHRGARSRKPLGRIAHRGASGASTISSTRPWRPPPRRTSPSAAAIRAARHASPPSAAPGPVHAYGLARKLGAPRLFVPPNAGVGSALGFFTAPRAFDLVRSHKAPLASADFAQIEALVSRTGSRGRAHPAQGRRRRARSNSPARWKRASSARAPRRSLPRRRARLRRARSGAQLRRQLRRNLRAPVRPHLSRLGGRVRQLLRAREPAGAAAGAAPARERAAAFGTRSRASARRIAARARDFIPHTVYDRYRLPPDARVRRAGDRRGARVDGHRRRRRRGRAWTSSASCGSNCRREQAT